MEKIKFNKDSAAGREKAMIDAAIVLRGETPGSVYDKILVAVDSSESMDGVTYRHYYLNSNIPNDDNYLISIKEQVSFCDYRNDVQITPFRNSPVLAHAYGVDIAKGEDKSFTDIRFANSINDLRDAVHEINVNNGFWEDYKRLEAGLNMGMYGVSDEYSKMIIAAFMCRSLALIGTEVSEAVEALRYDYRPELNVRSILHLPDDEFKQKYEDLYKDGLPSELAGIALRVLDFSGGHEVDIEAAIKAEMRYNTMRGIKHVNKKF